MLSKIGFPGRETGGGGGINNSLKGRESGISRTSGRECRISLPAVRQGMSNVEYRMSNVEVKNDRRIIEETATVLQKTDRT